MDSLKTLSIFLLGYINLFGLGAAFFIFSISLVVGDLALRKILPVYVTRKILHILIYLTPFLVRSYLPKFYLLNFTATYSTAVFLQFLLYIEVVRKKFHFLEISFAAVDREEDRPHSGTLLILQHIEKLLIVNSAVWLSPDFFSKRRAFYLIAYFTVMLGDGLAEPVGNWIKSPKYKTFSLFASRASYRTVAGSGCVFVVTSILVLYCLYDDPSLWLYLLVVPAVATLTEAISPRALDNPVVYVATLAALHFVEGTLL